MTERTKKGRQWSRIEYVSRVRKRRETVLNAASEPVTALSHFKLNFDSVFNELDGFIEPKGDETEDNDAGDDHIQLKYLGTIDNQVSQAAPCRKEFSDDDAYQSQAYIYLGRAEQNGNGAGEHHPEESVTFTAAQSVYQSDFFRIYLLEAGIKADDGAEDSHGYACNDNGFGSGAEPYDEQRRQCGFGQAVQYHQVGFQNLRQLSGIPQKCGHQKAEKQYQQKAEKCLKKGDTDVGEQGIAF